MILHIGWGGITSLGIANVDFCLSRWLKLSQMSNLTLAYKFCIEAFFIMQKSSINNREEIIIDHEKSFY